MQPTPLLDSLIATPLPDQLYHYTSVSGLTGIVSSRTVWATAASYLSDARELRHAIDLARNRLSQLQAEVDLENLGKARMLTYLREQLERIEHLSVCVFSLSAVGDLLSQWRSYCPPSAGYSIGFLAHGLAAAMKKEECILAPCVYDTGRQLALIQEAVDPVAGLLPSWPHPDEDPRKLGETFVPELFQRVSLAAPLIKDPSFFEEREWRVVWMPSPSNIDRLQYRVGRTMLVPYVPLRLEFAGTPMPTGEIIIGPTPHQYLATSSLSGLLRRHNVQWKALRPSHIPYRQL